MKAQNILVLTYWSYKDALIQTYTLPYIRIILKHLPPLSKIFLFTFEQEHLKLNDEDKLKTRKLLSGERIEWLPFNYNRFGIKSIFKLSLLVPRLAYTVLSNNLSYIHSWCTPAGALGYILSVITQKPVILDSYEPHAEASVENGDWAKNSLPFKILFALEKRLSHRANIAIAATEGMRYYAKEKYNATFEHYFVKPACTDLQKFHLGLTKNKELLAQLGFTNKIVCVYAGKFGGIYLDQEVFDFFKVGHNYWGDNFRILLLTNQPEDSLKKLCQNSQLDYSIICAKFVSHAEVPQYMGLGDFGITPVKSIPTKRYCTPIKDGEYWALGLPIVITPNISDDSDIIEQNNIGAIWSYKDKNSYIETIEKIDCLLKNTPKKDLQNKIRAIAEKYRSFEIAEKIYKKIYKNV
jgi:glycosyltransferase involved in cell wall biosynthesis